MRRVFRLLAALCSCWIPAAVAQPTSLPASVVDHFFLSSDGVRLHYLEAGAPNAHTIVFVPGWTMPAWIWMPQMLAFARQYHVVAFDPRGQGDSEIPRTGYEPTRRGRDIAELISQLGAGRVVIVGWSLGVLDTLACIHVAGDRRLAGLVLVDNSVGEDPPPAFHAVTVRHGPPPPRPVSMRHFVQSMFRRQPPPEYLRRLTEAALRVPENASRLLLAYPVPRTYWREALYSTDVPVLYAVRPRWVAQGETLLRKRPNTEMVVFAEAGHALFIDEASRFDSVVQTFLRQRVWR